MTNSYNATKFAMGNYIVELLHIVKIDEKWVYNQSNFNFTKEKKVKFIDVYFSTYELNDFKIFVYKLEILQIGLRYSILFRVCFGNTARFSMLGPQFGFYVSDSTMRFDFLQNFHNNILFRLETSMLNYNYTGDDIITVQLLIYNVQYNENIIKSPESIFTLKTLGLNKDLADTTIENTK